MNITLTQLAVLVVGSIFIYFALRWLWATYLRAHAIQHMWSKRIDALTVLDWAACARHLTDDEFAHLMKMANAHSLNRNRDTLAPVLRDVIVQFHTTNK